MERNLEDEMETGAFFQAFIGIGGSNSWGVDYKYTYLVIVFGNIHWVRQCLEACAERFRAWALGTHVVLQAPNMS